MQIRIYDNAEQIGNAAASVFAAWIITQEDCVIGMATGSTPLPTYNALIKLYDEGVLDFSQVRSFNLDEYVGVSRDHEQSYYRFMLDNLFSKVNIDLDNVQVPHPVSANLEDDCAAYEAAIEEAGGVDVQILGIGNNGHIAFNEPGANFSSRTNITNLTSSTIEANKRFFDSIDDVPTSAMTMGIGTIMKSAEIILVATGAAKAEAVRAMIEGPIDPQCPASVLQMHPAVTVLLDKDSAALLGK